jgi:hypothetical protein
MTKNPIARTLLVFHLPFVTTKMKEVFVAQQEIQKVPGTHDSSAASASLIIF